MEKKRGRLPEKVRVGGVAAKNTTRKVRYLIVTAQSLPFFGVHILDLTLATFDNSELGMIKKILLLHKMGKSFGVVSKNLTSKFTPQ